ncbi:cardiolipin synthase [Cytobacillus solani]|uniref:Cardiolipin synthase n=1 Tax=Cytobacillus solani TaxID=1637975 RepID=A0A0Q3VGD1_9BACI|nr:cardiolipin synthase [Cytobacillus solani]KOP81746.1 cardiolipin synthetase [Bacillus sp. FJAT-21945]KQL18683.1 cardiolipin synthase [Cytobacillus solani]
MKNTVRIGLFISLLVGFIFVYDLYVNPSGGYLGYISLLMSMSVIFIAFVIFLENRHPAQTLTWLVVLGSFPLVGFIFYLLFGRNYKKEKMFRQKYILDKQAFLRFEGEHDLINEEKIKQLADHQRKLFYLAQNLGHSPISFATQTQVLTNGDETFHEILESLKSATHHIHLEYYIVRHDHIGQEIKEILIQKVKEGVKVRFLFDAVGSLQLSKKYISELRQAGVEMIPFGPVRLPFLNSKINFRNHRKIIVIDGSIGFVGGLNIGDEYLGRVESFGFWRDTHMMMKGEAVRSLQLIFLQDWYYMTNQNILSADYLSPVLEENIHGGVQLVAGGPDNEWSVIKNIFFSMITSAEKSVWIASPYFIPDEDIFSALKVAALSGIDVRLLMPQRPDKKIVFYASRSYFPELLEAGVKIYEYKKGFMHSKIVIVDEELASIGTSNMDMRSFHLNFEVNAFLYRTRSTQKLVKEYINDLKNSRKIDINKFKRRHIGYRMIESTSRLLSPFL